MGDTTKAQVNELRDLVKASRGMKVDELAELSAAATAQGGQLVGVTAFDPDGDWCGTGRFRFKWPPKPGGGVGPLIDLLVNKGIGGNIIINGIPRPDEILINFGRGPVR